MFEQILPVLTTIVVQAAITAFFAGGVAKSLDALKEVVADIKKDMELLRATDLDHERRISYLEARITDQ